MGALSALGVAPENPAFPAVVRCPGCQQNTLHLFDDLVTDGIWLHCNLCAAHGDIITFATSIWNTSLPDALDRFADLNLVNRGEKNHMAGEIERSHRRQTDLEHFWADAESQVWNHGDDVISCRLRELGVAHEINATGLVGVAHTDQIAKICADLGRPRPKNIRAGGASLVFPYYDLPGRFSGVLLTQYSDSFEVRNTYIPVTGYKRRRPEAGYFLLKTMLLAPPEILKNTQFILDDPCWVLQLQCEQLRRGLSLLPLAASYTGAEANSYGKNWLSLSPITRLFQSRSTSPELISRACTARGYVCIIGPRSQHTRDRKNPIKQLAQIRKSAETWQTSLANTLGHMNEISAHSFASRLTISADKLGPFLQRVAGKFSAGFTDRVLANALISAPLGTIQTPRRWMITPRSDGWWNCSNHRVCSANVVIQRIVQADNGDKTYSGIIYLNGEQFEFSDNAKKIESMGLLAYAQAYMAPKRKLIVFDRAWNRRSHLISIELNNPELISVSSRLGWDERANVFRFSNCELTNEGATTPAVIPTTKKQRVLFPEPTPVAPPTIRQFLTPSYENAFTWTVFAAIAAELINPILRREAMATGIPGQNFNTAARIGVALGCEQTQSSSLKRSHVSRQLSEAADRADWPLFAASPFDDASYSAVVPKCHNRSIFVKINQLSAVIAPSYNWQVIRGRAAAINTDFSVLRHVLPAYIQRALRSRMRLATINKNTTIAVLTDLHTWLQETYEASFQLDYAINQLTTPAQAHTALMEELQRAVQLGQLSVIPHARKHSQPVNYLVRKKDYWWLNQRGIDRYFYIGKTTVPNWLLIVELLTDAGVFIGEELVRNMPGLIVNTQWGDKYLLTSTNEAREIG